MLRRSLKFSFVILLTIVISASTYILYSWVGVFYKTFHIVMHASRDAPAWISGPGYEVNVTSVGLSQLNNEDIYNVNPDSRVYIFRPEGIRVTPFVILVPGFTDKGAADKRITRISRAFAESGIGVAVPDSETMRARIFNSEDVDLVVATFNYLARQDYVEKKRIAICGFSVAGSYSLIAASELGKRPLFVLTFGGYYDLKNVAASVISGQVFYKDKTRKWIPGDIPRDVVAGILGDSFKNKNSPDYVEAKRIISKVSSEKFDELWHLSPISVVDRIRAPVYVLHSRKDDSIPVEESYRIVESLSLNTEVHFTEFSGLSHVTPKDFFSYDYMKLSWTLLKMMKILLAG